MDLHPQLSQQTQSVAWECWQVPLTLATITAIQGLLQIGSVVTTVEQKYGSIIAMYTIMVFAMENLCVTIMNNLLCHFHH